MSLAATWARRLRVPVWLNLPEMSAVLAASQPPPRRRPGRDLASGRHRIDRAAERRRRAVARAGR